MSVAEKAEAVMKRIAEETRPAAWLAFLVFMLKANGSGRYMLKSAGPRLICRLANKLPVLGVWASVSDLMTGQQLTKNRQILSALPKVSVDLKQVQKDLYTIAREIASQSIETDAQGRTHLDVIGCILTQVSDEAIESSQNPQPTSQ